MMKTAVRVNRTAEVLMVLLTLAVSLLHNNWYTSDNLLFIPTNRI